MVDGRWQPFDPLFLSKLFSKIHSSEISLQAEKLLPKNKACAFCYQLPSAICQLFINKKQPKGCSIFQIELIVIIRLWFRLRYILLIIDHRGWSLYLFIILERNFFLCIHGRSIQLRIVFTQEIYSIAVTILFC